jgi:hypothetical protein
MKAIEKKSEAILESLAIKRGNFHFFIPEITIKFLQS